MKPDQKNSEPAKKIPKWPVIILILIAGLAVYWNSFNNQFVFDDEQHVVENTAIRSLKNIPDIFRHHLTYFGDTDEGRFYRPVETITFMADYFLWGLDPVGYHITNTLLHIAVCIALFYVLNLLTKDIFLSAAAALIYTVHPVHTEAVTYVSGRADSLSALFLLLMIVFQHKFLSSERRHEKAAYYILILVLFSLALLSKESSAIFIFPLMLIEYCNISGRTYQDVMGKRIAFYLPLFLWASIWFILKNQVVATKAMVEDLAPLGTRLITVPRLIFDYVRLSFFPAGLHMEYKLPFPGSVFQSGYLGPSLFLVIFFLVLYHAWNRGKKDAGYRIIFLGLGWFFTGLIPYMSILFPLNAAFAEHWLYIPEMGLILFVVYGLFYAPKDRKSIKKYLILLVMPAIIGLSYLTIKQNRVWRDPITFYSYTAKHAPYSAKILNNLAVKYIQQGDKIKAKELLEKAVYLDPRYGTAQENLRMLNLELQERGT